LSRCVTGPPQPVGAAELLVGHRPAFPAMPFDDPVPGLGHGSAFDRSQYLALPDLPGHVSADTAPALPFDLLVTDQKLSVADGPLVAVVVEDPPVAGVA